MTPSSPWRALPRAVRRPVVLVATGLVVLTASGAGVAAGGSDEPEPRAFVLGAADRTQLAEQEAARAADADLRREADAVSRDERRADLQARQHAAAEAARLAQEEAARAAEEAAREAERQAALAAAVADPRAVARSLAAERGWSGQQFSCLDQLWTKESGWKHTADNPGSSAYGIPQALPGSKMASAGDDWETNPATQIRWGLGYIAASYGTPCRAWAHSRSSGWY